VTGWGAAGGLAEEHDGLIQICKLPSALEPDLRHGGEVGQQPKVAWATGRRDVDGLGEQCDGLIQICELRGTSEPVPQRGAEVHQEPRPAGSLIGQMPTASRNE
jgi:hypothetical protein